MPRKPNPQGKGLVPVLQSLASALPPDLIRPKQLSQVESELFTSLFVLQSDFGFQPVPGSIYHLYQHEGRYRLSLIAPEEWGASPPYALYVGACELHEDRTWSLVLDPLRQKDEGFMEGLEQRWQDFITSLHEVEQLEDALPVYEEALGFHGRVLAYALGKSLSLSMRLSGIHALSYEAASGLLTDQSASSVERKKTW